MSIRLDRIYIDRFGPLRDFTLEPGRLTVIEGGNEGGKSSIVDALDAWLRRFHKSKMAVWGGRYGRPGYDEGVVEVELGAGELPPLLLDNPLLLNLLVIPEGRASSREVGSARRDWLEEAKQHLAGFDPEPYRVRLRARGGLTPTGRDARDWTRRGETLAETTRNISAFLDSLDGLADHESELRRVRERREDADREFDIESRAVAHDAYRRAADALRSLEEAREALADLQRFEREDLDKWRALDAARAEAAGAGQAAADALREMDSTLEEARTQADVVERQCSDAQQRATTLIASGLKSRAEAIVRRSRDGRRLVEAAASLRPLWIVASVIGALATGVGLTLARPGITGPALALLAIGAGFLLRDASRRRRLAHARADADMLVADARRAGLDCESGESVMERIDSAERDALAAAERLAAARAHVEKLATGCAKQREAFNRTMRTLGDLDERIRVLRDRTGLPSSGVLADRVRERDERQRQSREAESVLAGSFPEISPAEWRSAVETSREEDPGRRPTAGRLQSLETERSTLRRDEQRLEREIDGVLRDGLSRLGQADLAAAREALEDAREQERERETIRRAVRLALDAIDEAELDVERHLDRALAADGGGAGAIFRELTHGRWAGVQRKGDRLLASAPDGLTVGVESLSRGTRDQLHFALRVALAERILGEPGFFVWDDTFLTADTERRRPLIATTIKLVRRGWQVIYLTVDRSIADMFESAVADEKAVVGFKRVELAP